MCREKEGGKFYKGSIERVQEGKKESEQRHYKQSLETDKERQRYLKTETEKEGGEPSRESGKEGRRNSEQRPDQKVYEDRQKAGT